jgi:hypothetical protein
MMGRGDRGPPRREPRRINVDSDADVIRPVMAIHTDAGSNAGRGFTHEISRLFREAVRLMCEPKPPEQKRRRRRTEDTHPGFNVAVRKIFRRIVRMPAAGLHEPELWQWNDAARAYQVTEEEFHYAEHQHLSPHL